MKKIILLLIAAPSLSVIGIINAIAVIGPRPGSIPIIVPAEQPTNTITKFLKFNAVLIPDKIPSIMKLIRSFLEKDLLNKYLNP